MRLIDELAAHRIYYQRPLSTLPDILLIDVPSRFVGEGLALDRYYPVILETVSEAAEFEAYLLERRARLVAPSLLDRRPSALRVEEIVFARYAPPAPSWPWLLLCCWPQAYTLMAPSPNDDFARGAYTIEAFASVGEVDASERILLSALGPHEARHVRSSHSLGGKA